jgi:hypothetical protein
MHTTVMVGGHERVGAGNRVTHDDRTRTTSTVRIYSSAPNAVDGRYLPIVLESFSLNQRRRSRSWGLEPVLA